MCGGPMNLDGVRAYQQQYVRLGLSIPEWLLKAERMLTPVTPDTFPEDWAKQPEPQRELVEV